VTVYERCQRNENKGQKEVATPILAQKNSLTEQRTEMFSSPMLQRMESQKHNPEMSHTSPFVSLAKGTGPLMQLKPVEPISPLKRKESIMSKKVMLQNQESDLRKLFGLNLFKD
jgi:hypothetical protein